MQTHKDGVWTPAFLGALQHLTNAVAADPRIQEVQSLSTLASAAGLPAGQFPLLTPQLIGSDPTRVQIAERYVNLTGNNDAAMVTIVPKYNEFSKKNEAFVYDLHTKLFPRIHQLSHYTVLVGGDAASFLDFRDTLYGRFPIVVAAVTLMIFIILIMFFQSVFLPLKAMFMNLVTILATYGALVVIFQYGTGADLLGFSRRGLLTVVTPVMLFVILFALSTAYEVFLLSRVKEYYHETGNNREALAASLQRTGAIITAAGLILVGTVMRARTVRERSPSGAAPRRWRAPGTPLVRLASHRPAASVLVRSRSPAEASCAHRRPAGRREPACTFASLSHHLETPLRLL